MKLYRNAIILVVIVALLVGAYFIISSKNEQAPPPEEGKEYLKLTNYLLEDLKSITLENSDGIFVIEKKDKEWILSSPADLKYDPSALSSIAINTSAIVADRLIEDNAEDLSAYGLDDPDIARLKTNDGAETVIEIGDETPTIGGRYVKLAGTNKVYVISSFTADKLIIGRNDIKSKKLFDITSDKINKLAMNRDGGLIFEAERKENGTWALTSPVKGDANDSALYPMVETLAVASVKEFVEEKAQDLSKYGLDKPSYEFTLNAEGIGEAKLQLGDEKQKGSEIYAKLEGSDEVFTMDMTPYNFLDRPLKEIVYLFAYIVNIDQVDKIDFTMDGKTIHMDLDVYKDEEGISDADKDKFYVNGIDASGKNEEGKQPFREFYKELIGIGLDEIEPEEEPEGAAEIIIDYTLIDGTTMKVEFISRDENYYYVVRNGEYSGMLVKKKNKSMFGMDGVRKTYKDMMDFLGLQ